MKKIIGILYLFGGLAYGQSTKISPNDYEAYVIKTPLNVPSIQHEAPLGAVLGTVIKADGVYLQTFNNKPFGFATGDFPASITINTNNVTTMENATKIGFDSPLLSQKKLTGITDGYIPFNASTDDGTQYLTKVPHGSSAANIASVSLIINYSVGEFVCAEYSFIPGYQAGISFDNTHIYVWNYPGNSSIIRNNPFTVLVSYRKL
jgi:hypothetical protein